MNKSIGQPKIKEVLIFDFQMKYNGFPYTLGEKKAMRKNQSTKPPSLVVVFLSKSGERLYSATKILRDVGG